MLQLKLLREKEDLTVLRKVMYPQSIETEMI